MTSLAAVMVATVLAPTVEARVINPCVGSAAVNQGWCGDGGLATQARLDGPSGVAPTTDGGFLVADANNNVVRRVSPGGIITRVAGNGLPGDSGDGGPATGAELGDPTCVTELTDGSILVQTHTFASNAVVLSAPVRRIAPGGLISTIQGQEACRPAVTPNGDQLVIDKQQVVRVAPDGRRTPVAGSGTCGFGGDDGPALLSRLHRPRGVAALPDGGFLIADTGDNLVRRVSPTGIIDTVAGGAGVDACTPQNGTIGPPVYFNLVRVPVRALAGRPFTVSVSSALPGHLTLTILQNRKVVARPSWPGSGEHVTVSPHLKRGNYMLAVTIQGVRAVNGRQTPFTGHDQGQLLIR